MSNIDKIIKKTISRLSDHYLASDNVRNLYQELSIIRRGNEENVDYETFRQELVGRTKLKSITVRAASHLDLIVGGYLGIESSIKSLTGHKAYKAMSAEEKEAQCQAMSGRFRELILGTGQERDSSGNLVVEAERKGFIPLLEEVLANNSDPEEQKRELFQKLNPYRIIAENEMRKALEESARRLRENPPPREPTNEERRQIIRDQKSQKRDTRTQAVEQYHKREEDLGPAPQCTRRVSFAQTIQESRKKESDNTNEIS